MLDLLKDMKKVAQDAKTVTMKHPSGHTIVLITKKLPAIQKEALKRLPLADGGEIKGVNKSEYEKPAKEIKNKYEKSNAGESKAGEHTRKYSEANSFQKNLSREEAVDAHHQVLGEMQAMPKSKLQGLAEGGDVQSDDQSKAPVVVNVGTPQQNPAVAQANTQIPVPQPNVQTTNPNVLLPNGSMSAPGAAQTAQEAVSGQQAIDSAKAQAQVPIEEARLQAQKNIAQRDQDNINALSTHADNLAANLKNVDPDAYRKNMSAPSKVATGLGLFLGGFSVPFGGQNFAGDFLNKQIDRDINAQIQNNEKQKTIWGAYNQLYGDQNIASSMAKASMADIYKDQIDLVAARLGTPQSAVNAQKLKSDLSVLKNKAILDAAGNLGSTPNNPAKGTSQQTTPEASNAPNTPNNSGIQSVSYTNDQETKAQPNTEFKILKPGAEDQISQLLKYDHTIPDSDKAKISEQMTQASQSEKGLQRLDNEKIFENLVQDTRQGGALNRTLRTVGPHAFGALGTGIGALAGHPVVGGAIGEGIGHMIPSTEVNRKFETDQQKLAGIISSSLAGRGDIFVQEAVKKFTPEYGDSPTVLKDKLRGLKEYIIDHTPTDALKRHGLSYK